MLLARDVKAEDQTFPCTGLPVTGVYQVGEELVALIPMRVKPYKGVHSLYAFRGMCGTTARAHQANEVLIPIKTSADVDC